jgi:FkbM family methyltransferase
MAILQSNAVMNRRGWADVATECNPRMRGACASYKQRCGTVLCTAMKRCVLAVLLLASCRRSEPTAAAAPPAAASDASYQPRYVFIDGGANVGQTILAFEKSTLSSKHPWTVVSFEPNPELIAKIPKRPNVTVLEQAIWTKDEELEFEFSPSQTLGGSVVDSVVRFPEMKKVKVRAIDFGQWLKRTYKKEDVVYVKFDIEGAEYPVIEHMLQDGTMSMIDRFYIEFHGTQQAIAQKKSEYEVTMVQKHDHELVQAITGLGIAVSLHLTHEPQGSYFEFNPEKYGQTW